MGTYTFPHTRYYSCKMSNYPDNSIFEQECIMLNKVAQKYYEKYLFHFNRHYSTYIGSLK